MNTDETSYTLEEISRIIGCSIEELAAMLGKLLGAAEEARKEWEALKDAFEEEENDENRICKRSYERQNKRRNRVLNAESKRKSRVAFHAAPGTCQYIRGRNGGGRFR